MISINQSWPQSASYKHCKLHDSFISCIAYVSPEIHTYFEFRIVLLLVSLTIKVGKPNLQYYLSHSCFKPLFNAIMTISLCEQVQVDLSVTASMCLLKWVYNLFNPIFEFQFYIFICFWFIHCFNGIQLLIESLVALSLKILSLIQIPFILESTQVPGVV